MFLVNRLYISEAKRIGQRDSVMPGAGVAFLIREQTQV
jgi:hypothetical protein